MIGQRHFKKVATDVYILGKSENYTAQTISHISHIPSNISFLEYPHKILF